MKVDVICPSGTRIHRETSGVCRPGLALTSQNKYLPGTRSIFLFFLNRARAGASICRLGGYSLDNSEPFGFVS